MSARLASGVSVISAYAVLVGVCAASACGGTGTRSSESSTTNNSQATSGGNTGGNSSNNAASSGGGNSSGGQSQSGGSSTGGGAPSDGGSSSAGMCMCAEPSTATTIYLGGPAAGLCPTGFTYNGGSQDWFTYNDGTVEAGLMTKGQASGTTTGTGGCDSSSNCAMHVAGSGFTNYGAGAGITLNSNSIFDASAFGGLDVWMAGTTTGTRGPGFTAMDNTVHVKFITALADGGDPRQGDDYGGYCPVEAGCYTLCHLPFGALTRDGFKGGDSGAPDASQDMFDPQNMVKIQFEFSSYMSADSSVANTPVSFDVWLDEIAWLPKGSN